MLMEVFVQNFRFLPFFARSGGETQWTHIQIHRYLPENMNIPPASCGFDKKVLNFYTLSNENFDFFFFH